MDASRITLNENGAFISFEGIKGLRHLQVSKENAAAFYAHLFPAKASSSPTSRRGDPSTSKSAGASVKLMVRIAKIAEGFAALGESTTEEVANHFGELDSWVSPRIKKMREMGILVDTGKTRQTGKSGKPRKVYAVVLGWKSRLPATTTPIPCSNCGEPSTVCLEDMTRLCTECNEERKSL